ncbi:MULTISPECIES: DUF2147 domain-containing protein [Phyllobacteriaceae]|uniref:DUF2147 domain-containing protein n=1 Tax=Phyllobacteriaceae TaxID=69277 RepID=UPI0004674922|nr:MULTISPECIES: DUF2147 domain-containing protein [Mesorhizobium]MBN9236803.1 DUF2147 domain-containing protein [Mesorhizobium sp.]MDQ0331090.1 uncharacterized protein (DUF2147 family) [Mesorhizobium sp. YL-MeA3-2017]
MTAPDRKLSYRRASALQALGWAAGLFLLATSADAAPADAIATTWLTHDGQGVVEFAPCGNRLCGHIVWLKTPIDDNGAPLTDRNNPNPKLRQRPICGLSVITGLAQDGSGGWDDGQIYDPKEGSAYDVALSLTGPDKLIVTGYLGVKALGQQFTWRRHQLPADQRCDTVTKAQQP